MDLVSIKGKARRWKDEYQIRIQLTFEDNGRIRSNQDCTGSPTTGWACRTFSVDSNVTSYNDGIPSVP